MAGIAAYACRLCEDNGAVNPCVLVSAEAEPPSVCPYRRITTTAAWEEVDLSVLLYQVVVAGCRP